MIIQTLQLLKQTVLWVLLANKIFQYRESDIIIKLYKSLVRPILEYGNSVWGPHYITDQKLIEGIQRRATKLIPSISHHSYQERLQTLNLPTQEIGQYFTTVTQEFSMICL